MPEIAVKLHIIHKNGVDGIVNWTMDAAPAVGDIIEDLPIDTLWDHRFQNCGSGEVIARSWRRRYLNGQDGYGAFQLTVKVKVL